MSSVKDKKRFNRDEISWHKFPEEFRELQRLRKNGLKIWAVDPTLFPAQKLSMYNNRPQPMNRDSVAKIETIIRPDGRAVHRVGIPLSRWRSRKGINQGDPEQNQVLHPFGKGKEAEGRKKIRRREVREVEVWRDAAKH